ncbi:hypothetical protein K2173_023852 [Erythroxylum novogranatense]|uniref:Leucine-rich repeat protein n=1 Tax=Erythroxylum novogranatense TaxID=1862640 RepID=A0AAV8TPP0_9ROSI|nr:hypothetical protein K2173_023852 [Erythroxylum novogranatense]
MPTFILRTLGPRTSHDSVDTAKQKLSEIECTISKKERSLLKMIDAEKQLVEIYENAKSGKGKDVVVEIVVAILHRSNEAELNKIDLSNQRLRFLPEAFGKIRGLKVLNLSTNQLQMIPDSIAGLENHEELNLASNPLETLPNAIGFLHNLKILDESSNKLETLPDTICHCRNLITLEMKLVFEFFMEVIELPLSFLLIPNLSNLEFGIKRYDFWKIWIYIYI